MQHHFGEALYLNLLQTDVRLALLRDPSELRRRVQARPPGSWVVIDEIQLIPSLLSEVHFLMESGKYQFAMSGSSARKLKRGEANLLAGRAILRKMYPLTAAEIGEGADLLRLVERGSLPLVVAADDGDWIDVLEAYTMTYLREEIQAEALVRNLAPFMRFLQCAGLVNAQVTNISSLARDAGVQRPTVQGYFQILQDTLVGSLLPAWRPQARIKEQAHPKFYWFDCGVARAMRGDLRAPLGAAERGHLLETFIFNELQAYMHYANLGGRLAYWRTPAGVEVDFIYQSPSGKITAIEVKASARWRKENSEGMHELAEATPLTRLWGVYLGTHALRDATTGLQMLPLRDFMEAMAKGDVLAI
jgi:predicted AAA+ superfamily ATPase